MIKFIFGKKKDKVQPHLHFVCPKCGSDNSKIIFKQIEKDFDDVSKKKLEIRKSHLKDFIDGKLANNKEGWSNEELWELAEIKPEIEKSMQNLENFKCPKCGTIYNVSMSEEQILNATKDLEPTEEQLKEIEEIKNEINKFIDKGLPIINFAYNITKSGNSKPTINYRVDLSTEKKGSNVYYRVSSKEGLIEQLNDALKLKKEGKSLLEDTEKKAEEIRKKLKNIDIDF